MVLISDLLPTQSQRRKVGTEEGIRERREEGEMVRWSTWESLAFSRSLLSSLIDGLIGNDSN